MEAERNAGDGRIGGAGGSSVTGRDIIRVELPEGASVVTLVGEHDSFGAETLKRELDGLLESGRPIVIDLGEATFIDSSTVGVLLTAYRRVQAAGLSLGIVLPTSSGPYVRQLIQTAKLDTVFPIHDSIAAALEAATRHP
jgi:anti-sigma B factor antagonist